jgi:[acyl-carrier-protein] S-malonyltransferase
MDALGGGRNVAWIFPGQGSQVVGMGKALYDSLPEARKLYDEADRVLGRSLSELCFSGPTDDLQETSNAQPALLVTGLAHLAALRERHPAQFARAHSAAGHSLGEYTALVAAEVLPFADALSIVAERGRLMSEAGEVEGSRTGMSAVLGLDESQVGLVCEEAGVDLANINAPGQIVISGPMSALERAASIAKERGARRVVPLPVSAAFHSRWMKPMAAELARAIGSARFSEGKIPVVANVTARSASGGEWSDLLERQTYSPVRWVDTVQYMVAEGVETFVEIGPGRVLSGLVKRIAPEATVLSSEELLA